MGKIINPATNKPFVEAPPNDHVRQLRYEILHHLRNRYDAAQNSHQTQNHWRWADSLSPNSANSLGVRSTLRERSRYETANNGYLKGITLTIAQDFVATGPKLQISDSRFNDQQRTVIEDRFERYCEQIKLRRMLWRMRFAKCQDGETFAFAFQKNKLKDRIKRAYRVFECDQVSSEATLPNLKQSKVLEIDGIRFDRISGDPESYYLLNEHPGESQSFMPDSTNGRWIGAANVRHWFRQDRGWLRGIPETTPTLPLWALLRRYTLAVVQNAEIAADFTVLLKSMQMPYATPFSLSGTGQPTAEEPQDWFDSFPIDRGLMTVLPSQYDMAQLDPKQPTTMYDVFVNALIQEACRPLLVPRNLAIGNSGQYNMSSGTLDRQYYRASVDCERQDCNCEILDPLIGDWWFEAVRIPGYFDDDVATTSPIEPVIRRFSDFRDTPPIHNFHWDEVPEHTDPVKVATAIDILHRGNHISDTDVQELRFNRSVDEHYKNLERQQEARKKLDLLPPEKPAATEKPPKKKPQR